MAKQAARARPRDDDPSPAASIGHNQPPSDPGELEYLSWQHAEYVPLRRQAMPLDEIAPMLRASCAPLIARALEIRAGYQRVLSTAPVIENQEQAGRVSDFREIIRKWRQSAKRMHDDHKDPFLRAGKAVDAFFNALAAVNDGELPSVTDAETGLRSMAQTYADKMEAESRDRARREAEEAKRRADQAFAIAEQTEDPTAWAGAQAAAGEVERAEARASAPAAEHTRVYGEAGSVTSARTTWAFEITDRRELLAAAAGVPGPRVIAMFLQNAEAVRQAAAGTQVGAMVESLRDLIGKSFADEEPAAAKYATPDAVTIRRAVVSDGIRAIPGVRIFQQAKV